MPRHWPGDWEPGRVGAVEAHELHWFKHVVVPIVGTIALCLVVYESVNPLPAHPVSLAPFIVLAWIVVGSACSCGC